MNVSHLNRRSIVAHVGHDARALNEGLAARAIEFCENLFPAGQRESCNFTVGSLNGESGRSLSICIAGSKLGIWKDFATGEGGCNLVELLRAKHGCSFAEACEIARAWLGWCRIATKVPAKARPSGTENHAEVVCTSYHLSDNETLLGVQMAERLIADIHACRTVARQRGWKTATIADLAAEASLGLSENRRLTFLYDTGAKERWCEYRERRFRFLFGKSDSLWRGGLLPIARRVFVTEGETDAISLVDAGAEDDGETLVVALPSANTWKPWWAAQLTAKNVVLCLDADAAGQAATEKLKVTLAPHVASLGFVDLEALLR